MTAAIVSGALVLTSVLAVSRTAAGRHRRHMSLRRDEPGRQSRRVPRWFAARYEGTALAIVVDRVWSLWLAGFPVTLLLGFWIAGAGCAALTAGAWSLGPVMAPGHLRRRAATRREEAVPEVLDAIARALRSGASLLQALGEAAGEKGPLQNELRQVVAEAERGAGTSAALDAWGERQPSGSIRLAAAALCLGAETGGANARAVDGVAATVRQRLAVAGEARALTAQPRVSAQVIGLAPVGFCALSAATDPELARVLFTTPLGWAILAVGLALDLIGMRWMIRMATS